MMDSFNLVEDASLASLTTFRIGGTADYLATCGSPEEVAGAYRFAAEKDLKTVILGRGSNVLASDKGFHGLVIVLKERLEEAVLLDETGLVCVGAGKGLVSLAQFALARSLTGLEFASGIPGTVGGALYMNAGAYDHSISEVVESVDCYRLSTGSTVTLPAEECGFGYRHSVFEEGDYVILSCVLRLQKGEMQAISAAMRELSEKRRSKQPLEYPSAGSTFKRPEGHFAGALIEAAGLKGARVGGAEVSVKHAGFIVSTSNETTARDVVGLMDLVRKTVWSRSAVMLEPEVRFLGPEGFVKTGFDTWSEYL